MDAETRRMRHGISVVLTALSMLAPRAMPAAERAEPPSPALAKRAFERFVGLAGAWRESSTKGWSGRTEFRVLARGSVVLSLFDFDDAAPRSGMASAVHLDGDRLLLTHYCEAGNQPRLVATRISPDAREIELEFLDGTGMMSRNEGHMDRVVFRFRDPNRFSSQWTWFQNGEERWMEEIAYQRVGPDDAAGTPSEGGP